MLRFLLLLTLLVASGCDTTAPQDPFEVNPGVIHIDVLGDARVDINGTTLSGEGVVVADTEVEDGPAVVQAGVPFDVTVYTNTIPCMSGAPSLVSVDPTRATIAVRDTAFLVPCNFVGTFTPRTDRITFDRPGTAEVVIEGLRSDAAVVEDRPYSLRFEVEVED